MRAFLYIGLVLCCLATLRAEDPPAPPAGEPAPDFSNLPDLDIVLNLKITSNEAHATNYKSRLVRELMGNVFQGLAPNQLADKEPKDGAAQYRIMLDYTVTATIGTALKMEMKDIGLQFSQGTAAMIWSLDGRQQGTVACKLLRWEGEKYKEAGAWNGPIPVSENEENNKGVFEVARITGAKNQLKGECPMKLEDAQKNVSNNLMPGSLRSILLGHFIQLTIGKSEIKRGDAKTGEVQEMVGEVSIKNTSPWPLKRVQAFVLWQNKVMMLNAGGDRPDFWLTPAEPIAPGKSGKVLFKASERKTGFKPGIIQAEFITTQKKP